MRRCPLQGLVYLSVESKCKCKCLGAPCKVQQGSPTTLVAVPATRLCPTWSRAHWIQGYLHRHISLSTSIFSLSSYNHQLFIITVLFTTSYHHPHPYMIFASDAADIVRGANIFMWSNFAPHKKLCMLWKISLNEKQFCSTLNFLLVMWSKIAQCDKQFCSTLSVSS